LAAFRLAAGPSLSVLWTKRFTYCDLMVKNETIFIMEFRRQGFDLISAMAKGGS
jgi:hypothetical protein